MPNHPLAVPPGSRPLAIAHRAGNDLALLAQAESDGADVIELDLWLYRNRLEVRHLKTMGRIPLLWDRWELAPGWTPRLLIPTLLTQLRPETGLLIDLKGRDPRLPSLLQDALARHRPGLPVVVCSRTWSHVDAFAGMPGIALTYSVGSQRQLAALLSRFPEPFPHAVSIHAKLLTPEVARLLKSRAAAVISWPVNTPELLARLMTYGIDGVTSDNPALWKRLVAGDFGENG